MGRRFYCIKHIIIMQYTISDEGRSTTMMMKKIIALAAAMLMSIGTPPPPPLAAKAEGEQARMLANYHNAVRNEAFYCEAYTVSTQQGTDLTKAEEVIAKSNMADYAIVNA